MLSNDISIAVLITCHNRKEKTLNCLNLLFDQNSEINLLIDVFLVDDGSTDKTFEEVKMKFPKVNIIKGDGSLFWNRGINLAWQEAVKIKPNFYLWLNDDTFLHNNSLNTLVQSSFEKNNQAIIIGSTISEINEEITYGGRNKYGKLVQPNGELQLCNHFNGNIVLIPNQVFEIVGYNDITFHHALGDFDYGLRARKLGIRLVVARGVLGICNDHDSLPIWCDPRQTLKKRWIAFRKPIGNNPEEFFIYNRRHYGLLKAILNYLTNHIRVFLPKLWKNYHKH